MPSCIILFKESIRYNPKSTVKDPLIHNNILCVLLKNYKDIKIEGEK